VLLRHHLYAGIVNVPEYGVRAKRGDFEPLISEELFYSVQAILSGRMPTTAPRQRSDPDFPLRAFVRCQSCGHGLTGSWSKARRSLGFDVALREGAAGAGLQIALEADRRGLVGESDYDVKLPGSVSGRVWTMAALCAATLPLTSDVSPT
jgi:hypothetical protein